jgi:hypothetical protein
MDRIDGVETPHPIPSKETTMTITLDHLTRVTQDLWVLAQGAYDNLPDGLIPVFELKTVDDLKRPGIGFPLDLVNTMPEGEVFHLVMREVAIQVTFHRLAGRTWNDGDLRETWGVLMNALVDYNHWCEAQLVEEASQSTKH